MSAENLLKPDTCSHCMVNVLYTDHLKLRLEVRKIPRHYPKEIYEKPDRRFFDELEGNLIAVKKLLYNKKERSMMIAYEEKGETIEIITIHPISEEKIASRIVNGRWTPK